MVADLARLGSVHVEGAVDGFAHHEQVLVLSRDHDVDAGGVVDVGFVGRYGTMKSTLYLTKYATCLSMARTVVGAVTLNTPKR